MDAEEGEREREQIKKERGNDVDFCLFFPSTAHHRLTSDGCFYQPHSKVTKIIKKKNTKLPTAKNLTELLNFKYLSTLLLTGRKSLS